MTLLITDKKTSACLKAFTKADKWEEMNDALELGDYIVACGETEWNRFENCLDVMVRDIEKSSAPHREDTYAGKKRVELHCHTKMSAMDGLNDAEQLVKTAAGWGSRQWQLPTTVLYRVSRTRPIRRPNWERTVIRSRSSTAWRAMSSMTPTATIRTDL